MDPMPATTPAHAKPRDHLWVLVIIAACCLIKVWPSWIGIGAEAGFPVIGGRHGMPTDWTLAVVIEAYWAYAVYAALAAPAGPRSRRFAAWSAAAVFALSLVGQSAAGVMAATAVKVFANALPVTVLALIAVLVHFRQKDREDAAEAVRQGAKDAEIASLRAGLAVERDALQPLRDALDAAQRDAEEANARRETAERKLDAQKANGRRTKAANEGRRKANAPANRTANAVPGTTVPDDFDARAEALEKYLANPKISGKELGEAVGLTARWGQLRKAEFAKAVNGSERSGERP